MDESRAGFALKKRDIVSVFKSSKCTLDPALDYIIPTAIQLGGNYLDCFNGALPIRYSAFGFFPVAKVEFNTDFAPKEWNYERDNKPDIIFMVCKCPLVDVLEEQDADRGARIKAAIGELSYAPSYDAAVEIQEKHCI